MSYYNLLDKDRLFFTQCNDVFHIRCLVCTSEKKFLGHCKMYRSFPAVWSHIRRDHKDIPQTHLEEIKILFNCIFLAFKRQMFPQTSDTNSKSLPETSSSLLFDRRPISRIDVWNKILEITNTLKIQSELYPCFNPKQLKAMVKVVLGPVDRRTMNKYIDCITNISKKDRIHGVYDVSNFCNTVGV